MGPGIRPRSVFLAMPAPNAYRTSTKNTRYTIRTVPGANDRELRRRAKRGARSLNAVTVEALARGAELSAGPVKHTNLDRLVGSWEEDPGFDRAVAEFERIDTEAWQ